MMRFIYLALFIFSFNFLGAQNKPIVSKVTATWCTNCGFWGWDFNTTMKAELADAPVTFINVHSASSDLGNPTSVWFAENLNAFGQPRFYMNNNNISVNSSNWSSMIPNIENDINTISTSDAPSITITDASITGDSLIVASLVENLPEDNSNLFLAKYIYEDNVEYTQAGQSGMVLHPNILRSSFSENPRGYTLSNPNDQVYTLVGRFESDWKKEELGALVVIWREVGDVYEVVASTSISNIALTLNTEEELDPNLVTITTNENSIDLAMGNSDTYHLSLVNMQGQIIKTNSFANNLSLQTSDMQAGMYVLTLRTQNKMFSHKVFVK